MKRTFAVALLASALLITVALPPMSVAAADEPQGTTYLALGDSLAYGWGNQSVEKHPYVSRFYDYLSSGHHSNVTELRNLGFGGETSSSFLEPNARYHNEHPGYASQWLEAQYVLSHNDVSVVTLDIGGNDLLDLLGPGKVCEDPTSGACQWAAGQALGTFASNYANILGGIALALQANPGEEQFITMTYYDPWSGTGSVYEAAAELMLLGADQKIDCLADPDPLLMNFGLNDIIYCTAESPAFGGSIKVADVYSRFDGEGAELTYVNYDNNIHPNNAGYTQIAIAFREAYLNR